ncbi:glutamine--fructose-6-phosphate transaminase (isomerizing) [Microaerobacter geothermalis]|uniref:glutamine--fructose-6-phosphate transaminase (isomerizing) n=1 Tax=Microaerobacter geothermalis TaxID=674972 RepID=UPI001F477EA7|nr:glutamine--fructose-6-phosphate transaminase (isomerizing) [Microaerobacter geothermalis]MCF6093873.1 glutamine--fructose-6-phosphate transaminase (isomerizing) [Microaerobacter geothermalis]
MCGIVGYIGPKQAPSILVEGLKKLEYRGYDSAGISVLNGSIQVKKAKGRLAVLEEKLMAEPLEGNLGIGHTRWATHGKPSDENAHPHTEQSGNFVVVHNGIIENYLTLKEELIQKGHQFVSETDTEVIAHLLSDLFDGDLISTVRKAVAKMSGAYALGIIYKNEPDKLVAVRLASPLIIGLGKGENFLASDIPAILEHTRDVIILNDGEMAILTQDSVQVTTLTGENLQREPLKVDWDIETAEKGGYDHFMLKEIYEQPKAFRNTMGSRIDSQSGKVVFPELQLTKDEIQQVDRLYIVACGTAYHAGLIGKNIIEQLLRIPVEVEVASEYRYKNPIINERTMVMVISQSGETADTLAALRESQRLGAKVFAITNVVGSSVAREADQVIYTWAGPEIAVASTKAYTSQLIALYLFAIYLAQELGTQDSALLQQLVEELVKLPEKAEQILANTEEIKQFAEGIKEKEHLFFIGRGLDYAVSLEGSLKLKEISYIHSEAYAAGELKHGTLALIEENIPVIALATQESLLDKTVSNITEVKARGAKVLGIAYEDNTEIGKSVDQVITIPRTHPLLSPALSVIPLQLLAYYTSLARGNDVDKPRNLAKSVTVE